MFYRYNAYRGVFVYLFFCSILPWVLGQSFHVPVAVKTGTALLVRISCIVKICKCFVEPSLYDLHSCPALNHPDTEADTEARNCRYQSTQLCLRRSQLLIYTTLPTPKATTVPTAIYSNASTSIYITAVCIPIYYCSNPWSLWLRWHRSKRRNVGPYTDLHCCPCTTRRAVSTSNATTVLTLEPTAVPTPKPTAADTNLTRRHDPTLQRSAVPTSVTAYRSVHSSAHTSAQLLSRPGCHTLSSSATTTSALLTANGWPPMLILSRCSRSWRCRLMTLTTNSISLRASISNSTPTMPHCIGSVLCQARFDVSCSVDRFYYTVFLVRARFIRISVPRFFGV